MRSMVEGACSQQVCLTAEAPSTALWHSRRLASRSLLKARRPKAAYAPFPACAGQDDFGSRPEQTSVARVV